GGLTRVSPDPVTGECEHGLTDWSAEEREAIALGVRARIAGLVACADLTILEVDFVNPTSAPGHCPATSTFVHRLRGDRSATVTSTTTRWDPQWRASVRPPGRCFARRSTPGVRRRAWLDRPSPRD